MKQKPILNTPLKPVLLMLLLLLTMSSLKAEPIIFAQGGDDTTASIQTVVDNFRNTLGDLNPPDPVTVNGGRRQINWDAAPDGVSAPNPFAGDFFNFNAFPRARGIEFTTSGSGFQLSATNESGVGVNFANINPSYANEFGTFSAERLFTAIGSNVVEAKFFLPGTNTPASISGLGVVFTDVDTAGSTEIRFYGLNNELLTAQTVPVGTVDSQSLSFLGVYFDAGERISRVVITSGDASLSATDSDGNRLDLVVMDDFIYAEPVGIDQIVVDTTADQSEPGFTTLRDAIEAANALNDAVVVFDEEVFSTPQTITLEQGEMAIATSVNINGPGADLLTIDADNLSRIFNINNADNTVEQVKINGITLTQGDTDGPGGCINSREALKLRASVIKNCRAGANGGGVHTFNSGGLLVENSYFLDNISENSGGGLFHQTGGNLIANSTFYGNVASRSGGGMAINQASSIRVINSTFSANQANNGSGAGISSNRALNINNSTIVNNMGTGVDLVNDNIQNSIIAGNTGGDCVFNETGFNNISNFDGDGSCDTSPARGGLNDPMLGPLAYNGGLTPTHLPLPGSPVIDNGFDDLCADSDQRGLSRPIDGDGEQGARCDMGAVEAESDAIFNNGFEFNCNLSPKDSSELFRGCR